MRLLRTLKSFYMNQYKLLKHENLLRAEFMSTDDQICLSNLLNDHKVSLMHVYDVELLKKELIGMGLETKQRGSSLAEAIGGNERAFVFEMIKGLRPVSLRSWLLAHGLTLSLIWLVMLVLSFSAGFPRTIAFNIVNLLAMPGIFLLFIIYNNMVVKRKFLSDNAFVSDYSDYVYRGFFMFIFFIFLLVSRLLSKHPIRTFFTLPTYLVLTIVVLLSFAIMLHNYLYSKSLAKEHPWAD